MVPKDPWGEERDRRGNSTYNGLSPFPSVATVITKRATKDVLPQRLVVRLAQSDKTIYIIYFYITSLL